MKKLIILSGIVFLFAAVSAFKVDVPAEFKFEKETHDFGKISQGKPVSVEFKFTNIGDEPLIITNIESADQEFAGERSLAEDGDTNLVRHAQPVLIQYARIRNRAWTFQTRRHHALCAGPGERDQEQTQQRD